MSLLFCLKIKNQHDIYKWFFSSLERGKICILSVTISFNKSLINTVYNTLHNDLTTQMHTKLYSANEKKIRFWDKYNVSPKGISDE